MLMNIMKMLVKSMSGCICCLRSSPKLLVKHLIASLLFCLSRVLDFLGLASALRTLTLLIVDGGHESNTGTTFATSFGLFLQVIVSILCLLK